MKKTIATLSLMLALAACSSTNGGTYGFPVADVDDDDSVTPEEYLEFWKTSDRYSIYDVNNDGNLDRAEYMEAVDDERYHGDEFFHGLDRNRDNVLSRQEFVVGWFKMFDVDNNGVLSEAEYESALDALED